MIFEHVNSSMSDLVTANVSLKTWPQNCKTLFDPSAFANYMIA